MLERAKEFNCPREAQRARPMLDPTCAIPLTEFAGLVASYTFPKLDWQKCQLEEKGSICKQGHGNGWIARRKDEKEGFIGKDCAHDHFGADSRLFKSETSRIKRELRIDGLVDRIKALQSDPAFAERITSMLAAGMRLRDEVRECRERWPEELVERLLGMTRTGNRTVVLGIRHIEKDNDGKEVHKYLPSTWGSIVAPNALVLATFRSISERLHEARKVLQGASAHKDQRERQMKQWVASLDEVDRCEIDLQQARDDLAAFLSPGNLKLLCWCVRKDQLQNQITQTALGIISGKSISLREAIEVKLGWARDIRAAHNGRDFNVAA